MPLPVFLFQAGSQGTRNGDLRFAWSARLKSLPNLTALSNTTVGLQSLRTYGTGTGGTHRSTNEHSQRPSTLRANPLQFAWLTAVQSGLPVAGLLATLK